MSANTTLSETNPNPGGGCLCWPNGNNPDCKGPYVIFHATEVESIASPHAVLSLKCAAEIVRGARKAEKLRAGQGDPHPAEETSI